MYFAREFAGVAAKRGESLAMRIRAMEGDGAKKILGSHTKKEANTKEQDARYHNCVNEVRLETLLGIVPVNAVVLRSL